MDPGRPGTETSPALPSRNIQIRNFPSLNIPFRATVPTARTPPGETTGADTPWWDPARDAAVDPESDTVFIDGVPVSRGSRVRVVPLRRADAQDLFFAGKSGRVTGVHFDVDGGTHVAVVLEADPAADLQEWYGRYLYFAPEELVPLAAAPPPDNGKEPSS